MWENTIKKRYFNLLSAQHLKCIVFAHIILLFAWQQKKGNKTLLIPSKLLHYLTRFPWTSVNNLVDHYSPAKQMDALTVQQG